MNDGVRSNYYLISVGSLLVHPCGELPFLLPNLDIQKTIFPSLSISSMNSMDKCCKLRCSGRSPVCPFHVAITQMCRPHIWSISLVAVLLCSRLFSQMFPWMSWQPLGPEVNSWQPLQSAQRMFLQMCSKLITSTFLSVHGCLILECILCRPDRFSARVIFHSVIIIIINSKKVNQWQYKVVND